MTDWMQELIVLVEAEFHSRRIVATLATVDADGSPRARMMVVRSFNEGDNTLWMTTDLRSSKISQVQARSDVELVFWMPHERQQFRLRGTLEIVRDGTARQELWQGLNDSARALFYWPMPGELRVEGTHFVQGVPVGSAPAEFVLLVLKPTLVEALELNETPHRRRRWCENDGWKGMLLNP